jgi:hypothetical protein
MVENKRWFMWLEKKNEGPKVVDSYLSMAL